MKNETRQQFNRYTKQVALLNGTNHSTKGEFFTVAPSISQRLITRTQESIDLLKKVNVIPSYESSGEVIGVDMVSTIAGRTDTVTGEREAKDPSGLDPRRYNCKQTNFDTALSYEKLDQWARFPDFQTRVRDALIKQQGRDWLTVGFNGTHAAADTNRATYPKLQDVNRGWLQALREEDPEQCVSEIKPASGAVTVGEGGDYANLDALVTDARGLLNDMVNEIPIPLVVLCSHFMVSDRGYRLYSEAGNVPSEQLAAEVQAAKKQVGGLPLAVAPNFPRKSLMITPLSNLSIFIQDKTHRRAIIDNAKRDQVEFYESINMAYAVEEPSLCVLIDNIDKLDDPDWNNDGAYL